MLKSWRRSVAKNRIEKISNTIEYSTALHKYDVGVIYTESKRNDKYAVQPLFEELSKAKKSFRKIIFSKHPGSNVKHLGSDYISSKELDFFLLPKESSIRVFQNNQYDALLNLDIFDLAYSNFICANTNSPLKIKIGSSDFSIYNMVIDMDEVDIKTAVANAIDYLYLIEFLKK